MNPYKIILALLILFSIQSCTKDVDFDQFDDANIHAEYLATLVHFNFTAPNFLDVNNKEIDLTTDSIAVNISEGSQKYLEKVEFNFVTENTFNREFTIEIQFFDEMDTPINILEQPEIIIVDANSPEKTQKRVIPESNIDKIFDLREIRFLVKLSPSTDNSVILINDTSTLNLKSYMKLFYNYRKI